MKNFDVLSKKEFITNGESKISWYRVGRLKMTENGGKYLVLFHQPEIEYYLVEQEKVPEIQLED